MGLRLGSSIELSVELGARRRTQRLVVAGVDARVAKVPPHDALAVVGVVAVRRAVAVLVLVLLVGAEGVEGRDAVVVVVVAPDAFGAVTVVGPVLVVVPSVLLPSSVLAVDCTAYW